MMFFKKKYTTFARCELKTTVYSDDENGTVRLYCRGITTCMYRTVFFVTVTRILSVFALTLEFPPIT